MITWLASYPRSGSTWLRAMLDAYLHGETDTSERITRTVPDLHASIGDEIHLPAVVKTHNLPLDHPHWDMTGRIVYLIREPVAVMQSASRFFGDTGKLEGYLELGGPTEWVEAHFGTWPQHVACWAAKMQLYPSLSVRYEELRRNTAKELARIVTFLWGEASEDKVAKAITLTHIDTMRKQAEAEWTPANGMETVYRSPSGYFVGGGYTSGPMTTEQRQKAERLLEIGRLFGYA